MAFPVPRVSVMIPGFPFLLQLSSQGPRGLCNKVCRAPRESRKSIKSQGPLGVRGKQGPDSHNLESLTSDHTNNWADSLTRPDRPPPATPLPGEDALGLLPIPGPRRRINQKLPPSSIRSWSK